jgi:hypothetical protein
VAAILAGLSISVALASAAQAQAIVLSAEEQTLEAELAAKILDAVKALPANASKGVFTGAIASAVEGYPPKVIVAAMAQVAGTPGVPAAAVEAARELGLLFTSFLDAGAGSGPGGFFGAGSTPGVNEGGFASGGGGGTASSYSR